eukprot:IDg1700t1
MMNATALPPRRKDARIACCREQLRKNHLSWKKVAFANESAFLDGPDCMEKYWAYTWLDKR